MAFGSIFSGSSLNHGDGSNSNVPMNGGDIFLGATVAHIHATSAEPISSDIIVKDEQGNIVATFRRQDAAAAQAAVQRNPGWKMF